MPTNVPLQKPMSFSWIWLFLACLFLAILLFLQILKRRKYSLSEKIPLKIPPKTTRNAIKKKYNEKLDALTKQVNQNEITSRAAYQELSTHIRLFIYEMTGIPVQNYTLEDIRTVEMPELETLVEEYYSPEFSLEEKGDILSSLSKTKEVISQWQ